MNYLYCLIGLSLSLLNFVQAQSSATFSDLSFEASLDAKSQLYYQKIIAQKGKNYRYIAAQQTLNLYAHTNEEYCSKLYNLLAEEALLLQELVSAKCYYQKVLDSNFVAGYYTEGLLLEQEQIKAMVGLRNIAMQQKEYKKAIEYHQAYQELLADGWSEQLENNKLKDAKILASCYQHMGQSEKAITLLAPYAFGSSSISYSQIDKQIIDYLTELLRSKYPKKVFRKMLTNVYHQIYSTSKDGQVVFYLQLLDNKIYFAADGANYHQKVIQNPTLKGQAIAHYQRKLMNSYFYQSLLK